LDKETGYNKLSKVIYFCKRTSNVKSSGIVRSTSIWGFIEQNLQQDVPVMLLFVLDSKGSSPGRHGFFMAVNSMGATEGSIGGGIMEHKFVELAKERLGNESGELTTIKKQIHDKTVAKDQSGMICSGEQTIFLYRLQKEDLKAIQNIISTLTQNKHGALLLSSRGIGFDTTVPEQDFYFTMKSEDDWEYSEKIGYKNELFIVGGGHCALALTKLMRSMDFYIRVYDDRKEVKTMAENHDAHEKHFVDDFSELSKLIEPGPNHYVVVMTVGYRTDDTALKALFGKKFRYFGLLGSQFKINKMMGEYRGSGLNEEMLQEIHAPAGIQIKSESPEEIAVSIAAEIIRIKNQSPR
jgi:xanthine dehydrogenase accessory factor